MEEDEQTEYLKAEIVRKEEFLTAEVVRKGLRRIGRHPTTLQHAFLELCLSDGNLTDIDYLAKYPHIMYLDVSKNSITSLKVLASLPTLVELNASANGITECLNFAAPLCDLSNAWSGGHDAAGSLLTLADLSDNRIPRMISLSPHRFLEKLLLQNNDISKIEGLSGLKYLQVLDLSYNSIEKIEGLDHLPIRDLRLRGNQIKTLTGLDKLPTLAHLDVQDNSIASIAPLALNAALTHLDLSNNQIEVIRQTEYLRTENMPWLSSLLLLDNPCCSKELYRLRALYRLPNLLTLDNLPAENEEKVRAFNLYHHSSGDLAMRQAVLAKHLPHVQFVDHAPEQLAYDAEQDLGEEQMRLGDSERLGGGPGPVSA